MAVSYSWDDAPRSEYVERAIVSGLVKSPHMLEKVMSTINADMFTSECNSIAFSMVCDHILRGESPNLLLIAEAVGSAIGMNTDRAFEWVRDLVENTVYHGEHTDEYARQLLESHRRRSLLVVAERIKDDVNNAGSNIESSLTKLRDNVDKLITGASKTSIVPVSESMISTLDMIGAGAIKKIPTGLASLDDMIGGFQAGQVVVLGGRPSMGKSALLLNIAHNIAEAGTPCVFFTREMSTDELNIRLISRVSGYALSTVAHSSGNERAMSEIARAASIASAMPLYIDEKSASMDDIVSSIRYHSVKFDTKCFFVDYLGLVIPRDTKAPREQQVAEMTRTFKMLAKERGVTIVIASQLNRQAETREDKRPRLADLRESGAIEQDADIVLFVHRPGYYNAEIPSTLAEIVCAKQRQGITGVAEATWDGPTTTFRSATMSAEPMWD